MDEKPHPISAAKNETIIFDDEEILYQTVVSTYFRNNQTPQAKYIRPYLRKAARQNSDSPAEERLHDIVTTATNDALIAQQKEIDKRWTKKKSSCCAAITGICSTALTAGVALVIHFTKGSC